MIRRALAALQARWHRWYYYGGQGRHCLDTGQMAAMEQDLARRPWPSDAALAPRLASVLSALYPCCRHCDHDVPWGGSETLTSAGHTVPCTNCGSATRSELPPDDDGYMWNPAAAILRATSPRLFAPDDEYWGIRYIDFYGRLAWDTAQANQLRAECGLPRRPPPKLPIYSPGIAA